MIDVLRERFQTNVRYHPDLIWEEIEKKLRKDKKVLGILEQMENSGGEPDVIGIDEKTGKYIYCDCSKETPSGRRSLCYDDEALAKRNKNPPASSAVHEAEKMGIRLLDEALYRKLQELGEFDLKTSSWILTPEKIREKGGALFCERRYGMVFVFHNSAESYYGVRGFRGYILI